MKKLLIVAVSFVLVTTLHAQKKMDPKMDHKIDQKMMKDGVMMKDGKMMQMKMVYHKTPSKISPYSFRQIKYTLTQIRSIPS